MASLHVPAIAVMQCSTSQGRSPKKEIGITPVIKAELKYSCIIYMYTQNAKKCWPCTSQCLRCPYANYQIFKVTPFIVSSPSIIHNLIIGLLKTQCLSAVITLTIACYLVSAISFSSRSNGCGCLVQLEQRQLSPRYLQG